jgi:hypothetical protein
MPEEAVNGIHCFGRMHAMKVDVGLNGVGALVQAADRLDGNAIPCAFDIFGRIRHAKTPPRIHQSLQFESHAVVFIPRRCLTGAPGLALRGVYRTQGINVFHCPEKKGGFLGRSQLLPAVVRHAYADCRHFLNADGAFFQELF